MREKEEEFIGDSGSWCTVIDLGPQKTKQKKKIVFGYLNRNVMPDCVLGWWWEWPHPDKMPYRCISGINLLAWLDSKCPEVLCVHMTLLGLNDNNNNNRNIANVIQLLLSSPW